MKIISILILSALILFGSNSNNHQIKILETIITQISLDKETVLWSDSKSLLKELKERKNLNTSNECIKANVLIIEYKENLSKACLEKNIFVLDYDLLASVPGSFGALFWKKGRPNIVILNPRIKAQDITISENLKPYLEEKIW